jgi:hypothetical protein
MLQVRDAAEPAAPRLLDVRWSRSISAYASLSPVRSAAPGPDFNDKRLKHAARFYSFLQSFPLLRHHVEIRKTRADRE